MQLKYTVAAGKYDGHERNTKYINDFGTLEEAFAVVDGEKLFVYPWCEIEIYGAHANLKYIIDCITPMRIK